jgi:hypothetical protein
MKDRSAPSSTSPGQRAASYWFIDGLPEIVFGLALLIFGAAALLARLSAPYSWARFGLLPVGLGYGLLFWKAREVLDFLKARLTYPRTGYVQPPKDYAPPGILATLRPDRTADENVWSFKTRTVSVIWLSFSLFLFINPDRREPWLAPAIMLALTATLYALNRNSEHPYRWCSAALLALMGLIVPWVDIPSQVQPLLPFLLAGAWLAAQGLWTLLNYLRENRA